MSIKILLADDHKIVREGVRVLLEKQPGMEVIAEAEDGRKALRLAQEKRPDVVIMDLTMPGLNGIEATRQITAIMPEVKVLVLSMHSDRRFVRSGLQAGASGFLLKDCDGEHLVRAIKAVTANQTYLCPRVSGVVVEDYVHGFSPSDASISPRLSGREREVLQLIAEGWSTKEIALHLHVSVKTVEAHRGNIMEKLSVRSIAELTKYAVREGLTSLEP